MSAADDRCEACGAGWATGPLRAVRDGEAWRCRSFEACTQRQLVEFLANNEHDPTAAASEAIEADYSLRGIDDATGETVCSSCRGLRFITEGFPPGEQCGCPPPYDECPHELYRCEDCPPAPLEIEHG